MTRRGFLRLGAVSAVAVVGGTTTARLFSPGAPVAPTDPAVAAAEAARHHSGRLVRRELRAAPTNVDLGGKVVRTWAYDGSVPGPPIRVSVGDELRVRLSNALPEPTTVHWHGLALRNDMDGVPGLTMPAVEPGQHVDYSFVVPHAGTYWLHPHVGVQLDTGLQAALIVEDPQERADYDDEAVLILDDWTDGLADAPAEILARLGRQGMDMSGMGGMEDMEMGAAGVSPEQPLGSDTGDVTYPAHLINGRLPRAPVTVEARPGRRLRLRLVNAAADTAYRFAVGGHRLTVTHADGFPVRPVEVETLLLGMGERYDVVITAGDGAFPIVAVPEGKQAPSALAVLRTASGRSPAADARPAELDGRLLTYADLRPSDVVALPPREPDRELELRLEMADSGRRWLVNGAVYGEHDPLGVEAGERVRVTMVNRSMMFHPMHVHGHTFAAPPHGVRKDTLNVLPMQTVSVDLHADNPGQWLVHCHNIYHGELGMMTVLSYVA